MTKQEQQILELFPRAYEPLPPQPTDELTEEDCIEIVQGLEAERKLRQFLAEMRNKKLSAV